MKIFSLILENIINKYLRKYYLLIINVNKIYENF
uniref:Uncharacterized protein n=1 Tax=viral metagenome TaxID=1070528 RepID=A0A6C0DN91_9ZZZZ